MSDDAPSIIAACPGERDSEALSPPASGDGGVVGVADDALLIVASGFGAFDPDSLPAEPPSARETDAAALPAMTIFAEPERTSEIHDVAQAELDDARADRVAFADGQSLQDLSVDSAQDARPEASIAHEPVENVPNTLPFVPPQDTSSANTLTVVKLDEPTAETEFSTIRRERDAEVAISHVSEDSRAEVLPLDPSEAILADFRAWLQEARDMPAPAQAPHMDLATIVQQFTALRHEVNLQTKASRSQLEQSSLTFDLLRQAYETIKQQQTQLQGLDEDVQNEVLRPVLKSLVDAYDALLLAHREVQRKLEQMPEASIRQTPMVIPAPPMAPLSPMTYMPPIPAAPSPPPPVTMALPFWARWLGVDAMFEKHVATLHVWHEEMRSWHATAQAWHDASPAWHEAMRAWHSAMRAWNLEAHAWHEALTNPGPLAEADDPIARFRQILDTLLAGYQMSLQRIERTLRDRGLETIPCVGMAFDPELMEVVEVVREPGRSETIVVEEVRPGYLWNGRLFRFAQVRVARP